MALLQKITYQDKASYASSPPCSKLMDTNFCLQRDFGAERTDEDWGVVSSIAVVAKRSDSRCIALCGVWALAHYLGAADDGSIVSLRHSATRCNTLQHTATRCNTLRHTETCCNTLHITAQNCNCGWWSDGQFATHGNTRQHTATHCNTLQHTATHCNTLQHTATHCNTLQHTATQYCTCGY